MIHTIYTPVNMGYTFIHTKKGRSVGTHVSVLPRRPSKLPQPHPSALFENPLGKMSGCHPAAAIRSQRKAS